MGKNLIGEMFRMCPACRKKSSERWDAKPELRKEANKRLREKYRTDEEYRFSIMNRALHVRGCDVICLACNSILLSSSMKLHLNKYCKGPNLNPSILEQLCNAL